MKRGIAWMARNGVAANLLLVFLAVAGFLSLVNLPQEVFPEFDLDLVQVRLEYRGASPSEVEESIVRRVEDAIEGVEGIRRLNSTAAEGVGVVTAELQLGTDARRALDDIQTEVDRITSFPVDAEEPQVSQLTNRTRVMDIVLYGDVPERALKELAERVKDDLTARPDISYARVSGVRDYEISVEVPTDVLRAYGLTLPDVAGAVRRGSLDLPGGRIETTDEEILVRVKGQNYDRADFERIVVRGERDGAMLRLGQIARIDDGFQDSDLVTRYDGRPAALVQVFRSGDERVLEIAEAVEGYLDEELRPALPAGVRAAIWENEADILQSRLSLLVRNGLLGLALVLLALTLFLNLRLAFWAAVGIAVSFLGTFAVMAAFGQSINMISLFGFILAIGIVVDDAIVVGENIHTEHEKGRRGVDAAIRGVTRIAGPVTFAILTTCLAFAPLLFVPGPLGKLIREMPSIVIAVLLLSLVEALLILPYHLSHLDEERVSRFAIVRRIERIQGWIHDRLQRFIDGPFHRAVTFSVHHYGLVISGAIALLLVAAGLVVGRHIKFSFLPEVEGDVVVAQLEMPEGTPAERTREMTERLEAAGRKAARQIEAELLPEDHPELVRGVYTSVGLQPSASQGPGGGAEPTLVESNIAEVSFRLLDPEERDLSAKVFERRWREVTGPVPVARRLTFSADLIAFGRAVEVELSHPDTAALGAAVEEVEEELAAFSGVFDVSDDRSLGKREIELRLLPRARTLGITVEDLARQVRAAYFGDEAIRVQRGRDEVRVYVRLPDSERDALADLDDYRIGTPAGGFVPLSDVAVVELGASPSTIRRLDGRRIITISAEVDPSIVTGDEINGLLEAEILPAIAERHPGLQYSLGGEQREQQDTLSSMGRGFLLALLGIFAMLAIPFRSYVQPLIIMASIPFGFVGAVLGHLIMGANLTMLSLFGIVGLSGVVVNDSLVLIDFVNEKRAEGLPMGEAIIEAARIRFRPVLLTSLTTFLGIFPLILERSVQAQFLVPLAVSIGFGILFATAIILLVLPAIAMLERDVIRWLAERAPWRPAGEAPSATPEPAA